MKKGSQPKSTKFDPKTLAKHKLHLAQISYVLFRSYEKEKPTLGDRQKYEKMEAEFRTASVNHPGSFAQLKVLIRGLLEDTSVSSSASATPRKLEQLVQAQKEALLAANPQEFIELCVGIDKDLRESKEDKSFAGIPFADVRRDVVRLYMETAPDADEIESRDIEVRGHEQNLGNQANLGTFRALKAAVNAILNPTSLGPVLSSPLSTLVAGYTATGTPKKLTDDEYIAIDRAIRESKQDPRFLGRSFAAFRDKVLEDFKKMALIPRSRLVADAKIEEMRQAELEKIDACFRDSKYTGTGSFLSLKAMVNSIINTGKVGGKKPTALLTQLIATYTNRKQEGALTVLANEKDYEAIDSELRDKLQGFTGNSLSFEFITQEIESVINAEPNQAAQPEPLPERAELQLTVPTFSIVALKRQQKAELDFMEAKSGTTQNFEIRLSIDIKDRNYFSLDIRFQPLYTKNSATPAERNALLEAIKTSLSDDEMSDLLDALRAGTGKYPGFGVVILELNKISPKHFIRYIQKKLNETQPGNSQLLQEIIDSGEVFLGHYADLALTETGFVKLIMMFGKIEARSVQFAQKYQHKAAPLKTAEDERIGQRFLSEAATILATIFEESSFSDSEKNNIFYHLLQMGERLGLKNERMKLNIEKLIVKLCDNSKNELAFHVELSRILLEEVSGVLDSHSPFWRGFVVLSDIFARVSNTDLYLEDFHRQQPIIKAILATVMARFSSIMSSVGASSSTTTTTATDEKSDARADTLSVMTPFFADEKKSNPSEEERIFRGSLSKSHLQLLPAFQHLATCLLSHQITAHCMGKDFSHNKEDFVKYFEQMRKIEFPGHTAFFLLMSGIALAPLSGALVLHVKDSLLLDLAAFLEVNLIAFLEEASAKLNPGPAVASVYPDYILNVIIKALGQGSPTNISNIKEIMRLKSELRFVDKMSVDSPDERTDRAKLITHCLLSLKQCNLGLERFWEHHTDHANYRYSTDVVDCYLFMMLPSIMDKPHNYLPKFNTKPRYKHIKQVVRQCNEESKNNPEQTIHEKRAAFFIGMMRAERWDDKGQKINELKASRGLFFRFVVDFLARGLASDEDMNSLFVIVSNVVLGAESEAKSEEKANTLAGVVSHTGTEVTYPKILNYVKGKGKFIAYLRSAKFNRQEDLLKKYTNLSDVLKALDPEMPRADSVFPMDISFRHSGSAVTSPQHEDVNEFGEEKEITIGVHSASSFLRDEPIEPVTRVAGSTHESSLTYFMGLLMKPRDEKAVFQGDKEQYYTRFLQEYLPALLCMAEDEQVGIWYFFEIMDMIPMSSYKVDEIIAHLEGSALTRDSLVTQIFRLIKKHQSEMPHLEGIDSALYDRSILIRVGLTLLGEKSAQQFAVSEAESLQLSAISVWIKDAIKKTPQEENQLLSLYNQLVLGLHQPLENNQSDRLEAFLHDLVKSAKAQEKYPYHKRFMQELAVDLLVNKSASAIFFMHSSDAGFSIFAEAYKRLDVGGPASAERINEFFRQVFDYFKEVDTLLRRAYPIRSLVDEAPLHVDPTNNWPGKLGQLKQLRAQAIAFFVEVSRGLNQCCNPKEWREFKRFTETANAIQEKPLQEHTVFDQTVIFLARNAGLALQTRLREEVFEVLLLNSEEYRFTLSFVEAMPDKDSRPPVYEQIRRMALFGLWKVAIETPTHKLPPDKRLIELLQTLSAQHSILRGSVPSHMNPIECLGYLFGFSSHLLPEQSEKNLLRAASLVPQFIDALPLVQDAGFSAGSLVHDGSDSEIEIKTQGSAVVPPVPRRIAPMSPVLANKPINVDQVKQALLKWADTYAPEFLKIKDNVCAALMDRPVGVLAMHYRKLVQDSRDSLESKEFPHLKFIVARTVDEVKNAYYGAGGKYKLLDRANRDVVVKYASNAKLRFNLTLTLPVDGVRMPGDEEKSQAALYRPVQADPSVTALLNLPWLFSEKPKAIPNPTDPQAFDRELDCKKRAHTDRLQSDFACYGRVLCAAVGFNFIDRRIQEWETHYRELPESHPPFMHDSKATTLAQAMQELNDRRNGPVESDWVEEIHEHKEHKLVAIAGIPPKYRFYKLASDASTLLQLAHNHAGYAVNRHAKMAVAELAEPIGELLKQHSFIDTPGVLLVRDSLTDRQRTWREHYEILQWVAMKIDQSGKPSAQRLMEILAEHMDKGPSFDSLSEFIIRYEAMNFPSPKSELPKETVESKGADPLVPVESAFKRNINEMMDPLLQHLNRSPLQPLVEPAGVQRPPSYVVSKDIKPETFFAALFKNPLLATMPAGADRACVEDYHPNAAEAKLVNQYWMEIVLNNASPYTGFRIANYIRAVLSGGWCFPGLASSPRLSQNQYGQSVEGQHLLNALDLYVERVTKAYPELVCIWSLFDLLNVRYPDQPRAADSKADSALTPKAIEHLLQVWFPAHLQKTHSSPAALNKLYQRLLAILPPDLAKNIDGLEEKEEKPEQEKGKIWINYFINVVTALFPENKQLDGLRTALVSTHARIAQPARYAMQEKLREYSLELVVAVEKQAKNVLTPIREAAKIAMLKQLTWDDANAVRETEETKAEPEDAFPAVFSSVGKDTTSIGQRFSVFKHRERLNQQFGWSDTLDERLTTVERNSFSEIKDSQAERKPSPEFKDTHLSKAFFQLQEPEHYVMALLFHVLGIEKDPSGKILPEVLNTTPQEIRSAITATIGTLASGKLLKKQRVVHDEIKQLFYTSFLSIGVTPADRDELVTELEKLDLPKPRLWVRSRMARILLDGFPAQAFSEQVNILNHYARAETIFTGSDLAVVKQEIISLLGESQGVVDFHVQKITKLASQPVLDQNKALAAIQQETSVCTNNIRAFQSLLDSVYQHEKEVGLADVNRLKINIKKTFSKLALEKISHFISTLMDEMESKAVAKGEVESKSKVDDFKRFLESPKLGSLINIIEYLITGVYPELRDAIYFLKNPDLCRSDSKPILSAWPELIWNLSHHSRQKTLNNFIQGVYEIELISVEKEEDIDKILNKDQIKRIPVLFKCGTTSYFMYGFKKGSWQLTSLNSAQLNELPFPPAADLSNPDAYRIKIEKIFSRKPPSAVKEDEVKEDKVKGLPDAVRDEIVVKKAHVSDFLLGFRRLLDELKKTSDYAKADRLLDYLLSLSNSSDPAYSKALRRAERMRARMNKWSPSTGNQPRAGFLAEECAEFVWEEKEEKMESAGELDGRLFRKDFASRMEHVWPQDDKPSFESDPHFEIPTDFVAYFLREGKGALGKSELPQNVFLRQIKEVSSTQRFNRSLELITSSLGFIVTDKGWAIALNLLSALGFSRPLPQPSESPFKEKKGAKRETKSELKSAPAPTQSASFEDVLDVLAEEHKQLSKEFKKQTKESKEESKESKRPESPREKLYKHICISLLFTLQEKFNHIQLDSKIEKGMIRLSELAVLLERAVKSDQGPEQKLRAIGSALQAILFKAVKLSRSVRDGIPKLQQALRNVWNGQLKEAVALGHEILKGIQQDIATTLYRAGLEKKQDFIKGALTILEYIGIPGKEKANPEVWKLKLSDYPESYEKLSELRGIFMRWEKLDILFQAEKSEMTGKRRDVFRSQVIEEFRKSLLEVVSPDSFFSPSYSTDKNGAEKAVKKFFESYLTFNSVVGQSAQTIQLLDALNGFSSHLDLVQYKRVLTLVADILQPTDMSGADKAKMLRLGAYFLKTLFLSWNKLVCNTMVFDEGASALRPMLNYRQDQTPAFQELSQNLLARTHIAYRLFKPCVETLLALRDEEGSSQSQESLLELDDLVKLARNSADPETRSANNEIHRVFEHLMGITAEASSVESLTPAMPNINLDYAKVALKATVFNPLRNDTLVLYDFHEALRFIMKEKVKEKEDKESEQKAAQEKRDTERKHEASAHGIFNSAPETLFTKAAEEFADNPLQKLKSGKEAVSLAELVYTVVSQVDDSKSLLEQCEQYVERCSKFNLQATIKNIINNLVVYYSVTESKAGIEVKSDTEDNSDLVGDETHKINRIIIVTALLRGLLKKDLFQPGTVAQYARMEFPEFGKYAQYYEQFLWIAAQFNPARPMSRLFPNDLKAYISDQMPFWGTVLLHLEAIENRYLALLPAQRQVLEIQMRHVVSDDLKESPTDSKESKGMAPEAPWDVCVLGLAFLWARKARESQLKVISYPYKTESGEAITLCRIDELDYSFFGILLNGLFSSRALFSVSTYKADMSNLRYFPITAHENGLIQVSEELACAPADRQIDGLLFRRELTNYLLRRVATKASVRHVLKASIEQELSQSTFNAEKLLKTVWNALAARILTPQSGDYWTTPDDKLESPDCMDYILPVHLAKFREKIISAFTRQTHSLSLWPTEVFLPQVKCLHEFLIIVKEILDKDVRFNLYKKLLEWGVATWIDKQGPTDILSYPAVIALFKSANVVELPVEHLRWSDCVNDLWKGQESALGDRWISTARGALKPTSQFTLTTLLEEWLTKDSSRAAEQPISWAGLIDQYLPKENGGEVTDEDRLGFFDDALFEDDAYNMTSFIACVLRKLGMNGDMLLVNILDMTRKNSIQIQLIHYINSIISACQNDGADWVGTEKRLRSFIRRLWGRPTKVFVDREPTKKEKEEVADGQLTLLIGKKDSPQWDLGLRSPPRNPQIISDKMKAVVNIDIKEETPVAEVLSEVLRGIEATTDHKKITNARITMKFSGTRESALRMIAGKTDCDVQFEGENEFEGEKITFVSSFAYQQEPYQDCKDIQTHLSDVKQRAEMVSYILSMEGQSLILPPGEAWLSNIKSNYVDTDIGIQSLNQMGFCLDSIPKPSELQDIFHQLMPQLFDSSPAAKRIMNLEKHKEWIKEQLPYAMAHRLFKAFERETEAQFEASPVSANSPWYVPMRSYVILRCLRDFAKKWQDFAKRPAPFEWSQNVKDILHDMGSMLGITFKEPLNQRQVEDFVEKYLGKAFGKLNKFILSPNLILPAEGSEGQEMAEGYLTELAIADGLVNFQGNFVTYEKHCSELLDQVARIFNERGVIQPAPSAKQYDIVFESKSLVEPVAAGYRGKYVVVCSALESKDVMNPAPINGRNDNLFYVDDLGKIFRVAINNGVPINEFIQKKRGKIKVGAGFLGDLGTLQLNEKGTTECIKDNTGGLTRSETAVMFYLISPPARPKAGFGAVGEQKSHSPVLSTAPATLWNSRRPSLPAAIDPSLVSSSSSSSSSNPESTVNAGPGVVTSTDSSLDSGTTSSLGPDSSSTMSSSSSSSDSSLEPQLPVDETEANPFAFNFGEGHEKAESQEWTGAALQNWSSDF